MTEKPEKLPGEAYQDWITTENNKQVHKNRKILSWAVVFNAGAALLNLVVLTYGLFNDNWNWWNVAAMIFSTGFTIWLYGKFQEPEYQYED